MYERTAKKTSWGNTKRLVRHALAVTLVGSAGLASASIAFPATGSFDGFVTTWESQIESIFSGQSFITAAQNLRQPAFVGIDIIFNEALKVVAPSLLSIDADNDEEFSGTDFSLLTLSQDLVKSKFTVSMFFVDTITYCGGPGSNIIGCGRNGGTLIALKSSSAASTRSGAALLAHELGHNLGLNHLAASGNLMSSAIAGATFLDVSQATTILQSSLLRGNAARTLTITPIAVVAAVPEPETWAMMLVGLLGVAGWARRRRASAS